jgi:hypothetical protein
MRPLERAPNGTLWMFRGDSRSMLLKVRYRGQPSNITGCTLTFTGVSASPAASLTGSTTDGSVSISNAAAGEAVFSIGSSLTSSFPNRKIVLTYQWVMIDLTSLVTTLEESTLEIRPNL